MINRAIALVLVLTVIQLAQGLAMRMEVADPSLVTPAHVGLGVVTALILFGLTRLIRRQNNPASADMTFLTLLFIFQGVTGIFILAEVEVARLIHLILSFFVVALSAGTLVIAASSR